MINVTVSLLSHASGRVYRTEVVMKCKKESVLLCTCVKKQKCGRKVDVKKEWEKCKEKERKKR